MRVLPIICVLTFTLCMVSVGMIVGIVEDLQELSVRMARCEQVHDVMHHGVNVDGRETRN